MRGLWMATWLAALATLTGSARAADDKTYDLRGPGPRKGQEFASKMTLTIKDADTVLKLAGMTLEMKMTMNVVGEEEQKVLAVDGRHVTRCRSKIVKERAEVTADIGGEKRTVTNPTALEGQTVLSERVGKGPWKHALVDSSPTAKQKIELDKRNGIENEDSLYPAEKVKVGHTWTVEAKGLTKLFGNSFTDITGKLDQKFVKTEDVDGKECAVIEATGKVKGKMKDDDGKPTVDTEMELKVVSWRELKTGIEVKGTFGGKIKLVGKTKVEDKEGDITLSGPLTGASTTRELDH